jgi:hypothetical protein
VSYLKGSLILYRQKPYIIERFIPAEKVPTKCKLQERGPGYNLYIIRSVNQPGKSAFVWESDLDTENKATTITWEEIASN